MTLLEKLNARLSRLMRQAEELEPGAPDLEQEIRYFRVVNRIAAVGRQIEELTGHNPVYKPTREGPAIVPELPPDPVPVADRSAWVSARADTVRRFGDVRDATGCPVALITRTLCTEGRMQSVGGWNAGGEVVRQTAVLETEDGRILADGDNVFVGEQPMLLRQPFSWANSPIINPATLVDDDRAEKEARLARMRAEEEAAHAAERAAWEAEREAMRLAKEQERAEIDARIDAMPEAWRETHFKAIKAWWYDKPVTIDGVRMSGRDAVLAALDATASATAPSAPPINNPFGALAALKLR